MAQFRQLVRTTLLAGTVAGTLLFVYQYFVLVPRIVAAEAFEGGETEGDHHPQSEWKPSDSERNFFTAASTILTGISFAALLLSVIILSGFGLDVRTGPLWGLAGFACFTVAPALGLPPTPPGVPAADVHTRQLWWLLAVGLTAVGLGLIIGRRRRWIFRVVGGVLLLLPHAIGAPEATGPQAIPSSFLREFALASILGNGLFWLVLGVLAGILFPLRPRAEPSRPI